MAYSAINLPTMMAMRNLFSKLYLQFVGSFVVAVVVIATTVYSYTHQKLSHFADVRLAATVTLASQTWQSLSTEEQENWLALVSTLSGTQWLTSAEVPTASYRITHTHIGIGAVHAQLRLDDKTAIEVEIDDWPEWEKLIGWLVLSELSNVSANLREARFQQLKALVPFSIARVNRAEQPLGTLDIRQLNNGQAVRTTDSSSNQSMLYFPAGASQVIRMGPIDSFVLLTPGQWFLLVSVSLLSLSLMFSLAVRPLHHRFIQLHRAVGRIDTTPESVQLPTDFDDQFGDLAKRIDALASGLIKQLNANKRLNMAVSHDLKTPLARIKFALALLDEKGDNPYAAQINQDVSLLNELISELLLYHQLSESASSQIECDGMSVLQPILDSLPKAIKVEQHIPTGVSIPMSVTDWRRVASNLIDNAAQYAQARVLLSLEASQTELTFTVEDDGEGLSSDDFELLKQPFQRASGHRSSQQAHHGLGLALVDATVAHYGGKLQLTEGTLGGASIQVTLPYNSGTK